MNGATDRTVFFCRSFWWDLSKRLLCVWHNRRVMFQHPMLQILPFHIKIACWVSEWEEEGIVLDCRCKRERDA